MFPNARPFYFWLWYKDWSWLCRWNEKSMFWSNAVNLLFVLNDIEMILKYWKLSWLFQRTFHGNWFAREKVAPAGSGCGAVTVVYKPVAFQDSAAVTFDHTWSGVYDGYTIGCYSILGSHCPMRQHQESRVNVGFNNLQVFPQLH